MRVLVAASIVLLLLLCGCAREQEAEAEFHVAQRNAATRAGLSLDRARELIAQVGEVDATDVTVMHRSVEGRVATVLASVPAAPEMLGDDPIEVIDLRWDLDHQVPLTVQWSERIQFAPRDRVGPEEARKVAGSLLKRWVPEVAAPAGGVESSPAQRLRAPIYVFTWTGMLDGHMTGDEAVVEVSSVTGLPISFSQRIAPKRPSPDSIKVTRDEALQIVRDHLRKQGETDADSIALVGQLVLSAEGHPRAGPAWMIAQVDSAGRQMRVLMVDAMTGEVLVPNHQHRGNATGGADE